MDSSSFYASLTDLESRYWDQFKALFQRVSAQKPEKGIQTLIIRARAMAAAQNIELAVALEETLAAATQRTERRIALLNACPVVSTPQQEPPGSR
ncbi:hypothetical protein [Vampirovibrio sp.]|uniref:hypothetical protein n=1 Tax=Vampirovibrio sp. TaxID=2717857 RepID=UPI0035934180